jgi:HSP20 family molecular chaperone IbpA
LNPLKTFSLKLDAQEAGAIIKSFRSDIENEIPSQEFLKYFLRLGYETREKEKTDQRLLQASLDKGLLILDIPYAAEKAPKKIEIKSTSKKILKG